MKRKAILIFISILILIISGCSDKNRFAGATFEDLLKTEVNNEVRYNNAVYLTSDKFFFTTEDKNKENTFGNPAKLVVYNLLTGEKDYPLNFYHSDIKDMILVGKKLYFTTYANTETSWGFCLFSLDTDTYEVETIYETHNTVDNIYLACIDSTVYYLCCADNSSYELHMIKNNDDTVIKNYIICRYADMYAYNSNIYITIYKHDGLTDYYIIDSTGTLTETDDINIPDYYEFTEHETISGRILSSKFGRYYILEDKIPEKYTDDECGYEYTIGYYIYDSKTKKIYNLSEATYWHYYI